MATFTRVFGFSIAPQPKTLLPQKGILNNRFKFIYFPHYGPLPRIDSTEKTEAVNEQQKKWLTQVQASYKSFSFILNTHKLNPLK